MKFTLNNDGTLNCLSDSGSNYTITASSCECKGFTFRRICKHYSEAQRLGWIDKLQKMMEADLNSSDIDIRQNTKFVEMRTAALKIFLEKNSISVTKAMLDKIEPRIKTTTKPEEVLQWAIA